MRENNQSLARVGIGVNSEGDSAVVDIVGKCVSHHSHHHDDVLTGLLHREEGDDIVWQILPSETFEQNPADAKLESKTEQETADEEEQLALEVVLGLEYPVAVPQETIDDTEDVAHHIRDTIGETHLGIEQIEDHERDERIEHANHTVFQ